MDILSEVISLQCSWVKRLYDNSSHPWKIIPSHLINTYLRKNFKLPANKIKHFPIYYNQIFKRWSENLSSSPSIPPAIASQIIWYNKCIKVDNKTLHNFKISRKDINYVGQLFKCDGKPKLWEELKNEFNLQDQLQFTYNQIMHSIPKSWKDAFIVNSEIIKNLIFEGHHLIKNHQIYCLNKLTSKEIYNILIESTDSKPSAQIYYKNFFQNTNLDWKTIYMLPRIVTKDSRLQVFQYKLLNNVLYLNKMLFKFGKIDSLLCPFCKMIEETPLHLFYDCLKTKLLWDQLKDFISNETLSFPSLTPKSAILGHINLSDDYLLINHIIVIYKFYIYNSRIRCYLNFEQLKAIIDKTKKIKEEISKRKLKKRLEYFIKWHPFTDDLV